MIVWEKKQKEAKQRARDISVIKILEQVRDLWLWERPGFLEISTVKTKAKFSSHKSINLWSNKPVRCSASRGLGRMLCNPEISAQEAWCCSINPEAWGVTSSQTQPLLINHPLYSSLLLGPPETLMPKEAMKSYDASFLESFPLIPNQAIMYV